MDSVGSLTGAGSRVDSVGSLTGEGSRVTQRATGLERAPGVDSVGSWSGLCGLPEWSGL